MQHFNDAADGRAPGGRVAMGAEGVGDGVYHGGRPGAADADERRMPPCKVPSHPKQSSRPVLRVSVLERFTDLLIDMALEDRAIPHRQPEMMQTSTSLLADWYVGFTKPRQEAVARDNLMRQGFEVYLPKYKVFKRGQRSEVFEPMFPRYLMLSPENPERS